MATTPDFLAGIFIYAGACAQEAQAPAPFYDGGNMENKNTPTAAEMIKTADEVSKEADTIISFNPRNWTKEEEELRGEYFKDVCKKHAAVQKKILKTIFVRRGRPEALTREQAEEAARLHLAKLSDKAIALRMGVSVPTVRSAWRKLI